MTPTRCTAGIVAVLDAALPGLGGLVEDRVRTCSDTFRAHGYQLLVEVVHDDQEGKDCLAWSASSISGSHLSISLGAFVVQPGVGYLLRRHLSAVEWAFSAGTWAGHARAERELERETVEVPA